jgi:5-(carboxyamino)imidazole ribonucleotide synthase
VILPPATVGVLGGGQLGRFFVLAAREHGYETWVLDPDPGSPAGSVAHRHLRAAYDDDAALDEMGATCAAVTTEFENVPAHALDRLAATTIVRPGSGSVRICQDRIAEKGFVREQGIATAPYAVVTDDTALDLPADLFPGILKVARLGYDGKGQVAVAAPEDLAAAHAELGGAPAVLERKVPLDVEISVVVARDAGGSVAVYPPAENRHVGGILDVSIVPARVDDALAAQAAEIAVALTTALDHVGTLAVELFVSDGRVLVNEIAPRPHNSGHGTIDGCTTSQFEQQLRALCGLPLGETRAHSPNVMVNLLGDLWSPEPDWAAVVAVPGANLHLYGKAEAKPGRKMGHVTVVADDLADALARADDVRRAVGLPADLHPR